MPPWTFTFLETTAAVLLIGALTGTQTEVSRTGRTNSGPQGPLRIVFLGDSIIEGHTLPLLFQEALRQAGRTVPLCFNAGIGGDTLAGMRARIERDVLPYRPDVVVVSGGINDVGAGRSIEAIATDAAAIVQAVRATGAAVVLMTPSALTGPKTPMNPVLEQVAAALKEVGREAGCPVADVFAHFQTAAEQGVRTTEEDHAHLNLEGYRLMTRALLDALGWEDVAVPPHAAPSLLPGVVTRWKLRAAGATESPLTTESVRGIVPDERWVDYALPEPEAIGHWWRDQERQRGVAMRLEERLGPAPRYIGHTTWEERKAHNAWLNAGAGLRAAWLNGEQVYRKNKEGWALGRERIPVQLLAGKNTLVIECVGTFFLSLTESCDW